MIRSLSGSIRLSVFDEAGVRREIELRAHRRARGSCGSDAFCCASGWNHSSRT